MSDTQENPGSRRERSARYPSVPLAESVAFCRQMDELGIDGLTAPQIATAMGYRNVKTNTFSGRLSSARQFNLIVLNDQNYSLTELARRILHPIDPEEVPVLLRQSCLSPHLYSEILRQYAGKRLPEPEILGNLMMHRHHITASAKSVAAEAFFDSIRHAGLVDDQRVVDASLVTSEQSSGLHDPRVVGQVSMSNIVHTSGAPAGSIQRKSVSSVSETVSKTSVRKADEVRLDLTLWDSDEGKQIRFRAPSSLTQASLDRFIEALKLAVRVVDRQKDESETQENVSDR